MKIATNFRTTIKIFGYKQMCTACKTEHITGKKL